LACIQAPATPARKRTVESGETLLETNREKPQTLWLEFLPDPGESVVVGLVRLPK